MQEIQKESLCSQVNLPGMLASGALTTRPDLASEPQEPREGLEGRSVLEGLLGFFHKLFTEVLKYVTGRHKSIQIISTQFICHKTDRIM